MKTMMKMALGGFMALATLGSCKDTKTETETEIETTTDATEVEMETAADTAIVVDDDAVPGTTSGEMEQVP